MSDYVSIRIKIPPTVADWLEARAKDQKTTLPKMAIAAIKAAYNRFPNLKNKRSYQRKLFDDKSNDESTG